MRQQGRPYLLNAPVLRVARPGSDFEALVRFYRDGMGMTALDHFSDHDGFDGIMLGQESSPYHLEFTKRRNGSAEPAASADSLLIFYLPESTAWEAAVQRMRSAGFSPVSNFNSYWDREGVTFKDPDGHRVVLQHSSWDR